MEWSQSNSFIVPESHSRSSTVPVSQSLLGLIAFLRDYFSQHMTDAYLVGGTVRDFLLKRETQDLDVAVNMDSAKLAEELALKLNASLVPIGRTYGLTRLIVDAHGHQQTIDITAYEGDILDDLARRDFTIDAMALPLRKGSSPDVDLIDPLNATQDLKKKLIRAVNPSALEVDPARLLRAARLAAQLGFSIEASTRELIKSRASLISTIAQERVRDELMKLLAQPNSAKHLRMLDDLNLLCAIVPELEAARGVQQPKEHHWDVFYHSIEAVQAVEKVVQEPSLRDSDPVLKFVPWHTTFDGYFQQEVSDGFSRFTLLKLTALLHDIAKPQTKTIEETGRMRFFGHPQEGAEVADAVLKRLRFSGRGISMVCKMIKFHLRPSQMNQPGELPTRRAIYKYYRDMGDVAIDTMFLNLADYLAARGPNIDMQDWETHCRVIEHVLSSRLETQGSQVVYKLIDGHDIMQTFGLTSGPLIGELLQLVQEAQGAGEITTREEALALVRDNVMSREIDA